MGERRVLRGGVSLRFAVALTLFGVGCGGPHLVISPDPDAVTVGVGLDARFAATISDCGGFGDCRQLSAAVRFEELGGSLLATGWLTWHATAPGETRLRLRGEDLEREVTIRAAAIGQSAVQVDTLPGSAEVLVFRDGRLRVLQRHHDTTGAELYGTAPWLVDGLSRAANADALDVVVPAGGLSITTRQAPPLRLTAVEETAIARLDIARPADERPGQAELVIHVVPFTADGQAICGGHSTGGPTLVASAGLQGLVSNLVCGVNLTVRRLAPGAQSLEVRWGGQSPRLAFD